MPLITISRSLGCGGTMIAQRVAKRLNLNLFDDQRLQDEAIKMGIRSEELKGLDEKAPGLFDRVWSMKPELYLDLMEAVVYEVARGGHGVILGHGSQMLLREFGCALHVLIHASEASRVQHVMDQHGLSHEAAQKMVRKSDHERKGFLRFAFHMDWNDSSLYDMIISTEKMGTDLAVRLIIEAATSETIKECSLAAIDAMEHLSLSKRIEAALIKNNFNLTMLHIEVPTKGTARIGGLTYNEEDKARLVEVITRVPGVSDVQSEVVVIQGYGL